MKHDIKTAKIDKNRYTAGIKLDDSYLRIIPEPEIWLKAIIENALTRERIGVKR